MTKPGVQRFAAVNDDPRFRRPKKEVSKVRVDDRFKGMFEEKDFVHPVSVDKYGRKVRGDQEKETLKRFYQLDNDDDDEEEEDKTASDDTKDAVSDSELSAQTDSSDYDPSQYSTEDPTLQHPSANQNVVLGEATKRLALVNMDWDQIRAVDILSFALAFKPPVGTIDAVKVYPSDFGKERLAAEASQGPSPPPVPVQRDDPSAATTTTTPTTPFAASEQHNVDEVQLRRYQLDRLRYYYAVIECDSADTAHAIYRSCDGLEFEQSGNIVDLRFIPDDVCFGDSEPVQTAASVDSRYRGKTDLCTAVLQTSSAKLTWDQDDPERARVTKAAASMSRLSKAQRKKIDFRDLDVAAYLASGSSSEEDDHDGDADKVEEYRKKLLQPTSSDVFGRSRDGRPELDITFASAFAPTTKSDSDVDAEATFEMSNGQEEDDGESDSELTVFQRQQLKRKQKKAEKRAKRRADLQETKTGAASIGELAALLKGSDAVKHFDLLEEQEELRKHKKKKSRPASTKNSRQDATGDADVDAKDPRFAAIYDRPEYAIDPSAAAFKRTPGMQALLEERSKRRGNEQ